MKSIKFFIFLFVVNTSLSAQNKFSRDTVNIHIYELVYNRNGEALRQYLKYENPEHRYQACLGYASIADSTFEEALIFILKKDSSPMVRRAAAKAIGQLRLPHHSNLIYNLYLKERDKTVQSELIEAIGKCTGKAAIENLNKIDFTEDTSIQLGYTRALFYCHRYVKMSTDFLNKIKALKAKTKTEEIKVILGFLIEGQAQLYVKAKNIKTTLPLASYPIAIVQKEFQLLKNPYLKVEHLKKLPLTADNYLSISQIDTSFVVKTYCIEKYMEMTKRPTDEMLTSMLASGNLSYISMACIRIREDSLWNKNPEDYLPLLETVMSRIILPRDFETWQDLYRLSSSLQGIETGQLNYFESGYRNDLKWNYITNIPDTQKVRIKTTKGDIIIQCYVNESPGSVSNFLQMVETGYYNNKYFHRLVPNFVIQGGCPRGDGWGTLNWIQRSEFSNELSYSPGSVGLASSGKDSEGVQIFITHTYTAQLNGRYSIFAKVTEGMDVVNSIGVGDQILLVEIIR